MRKLLESDAALFAEIDEKIRVNFKSAVEGGEDTFDLEDDEEEFDLRSLGMDDDNG